MKRDITRYMPLIILLASGFFMRFTHFCTDSIILLFLQAKKPRRRVIDALVDVGCLAQSDLMPPVIHLL